MTSQGRGGAGNFTDSSKSAKIDPKDLQTPTLKTDVVTTGRGGQGNMAKNTDPTATRALQDVEPVTRRESMGATHVGRGGGGNIVNAKDLEAAKNARDSSAIADEPEKDKADKADKKDGKSLVDKGKEWLKGKK